MKTTKPTTGKCDSDEVMCTDKRRCIKARWVCDGEIDCRGGEDEKDCRELLFCCYIVVVSYFVVVLP